MSTGASESAPKPWSEVADSMPKSREYTLHINGQTCTTSSVSEETVLQVAQRYGISIPTLCNDTRLTPAGACRTCLVEVEGEKRLQPACSLKAKTGMVVVTHTPRIQRHLRTLLGLYLADHIPLDSMSADNALGRLAQDVSPPTLHPLRSPRSGRPFDRNPYIHYSPNLCILCTRCTRYCAQVEGVSAISLAERGARTTIATAMHKGLLDTSCELCGGCIDVCPTGAMTEKKALGHAHAVHKVRTTCNYCGVGCQLDLNVGNDETGKKRVIKITSPAPTETVNDGNLCVKGRFSYEFIEHHERLKEPMVRGVDGQWKDTSWTDAINRTAQGLKGVADRHGVDALGFISSSRCTGEENYLMQKIARAAFGTNNCHQCAAT